MPYSVKEIATKYALEDTLNSALVLGPLDNSLPVGGRTLIFTVPLHTVTFSGAVGSLLTLDDIASEIHAAHTDFDTFTIKARTYPVGQQIPSVPSIQRVFVIQNDTGFTLDKDGTANPYLKAATAADTVVPAAIDPTKIVVLSQGMIPGQYLLVVEP